MLEKQQNPKNIKKFSPILRAILEVGFIVFLFYSNLLMGEFTRSGLGHSKGLFWAVQEIFTKENFLIAIILGLIGHLVFETLIERF